MRHRARDAGLKAGGAGGLTSASRQIHLPIGLAGPRWRGRVPPPPLFLSCLLHLLVVVVPAGSRAVIRDNQAGLGGGLGVSGGRAVPGELVPSDVVHEAVAHVQPPARLAAEPWPEIRGRFHLEPWARIRFRPNGLNSRPPAQRARYRPPLAFRPRGLTFRPEKAAGPSGSAR